MAIRRVGYALILFAAFLFFLFFRAYLSHLLFLFFLLLPVFSLLLALPGCFGVHCAIRVLASACHTGSGLSFKITAENKAILPCMFVRVDILAQNRLAQGEPCGCVRQKVYLSLGARGSQSAKSEIISPYCGKVDITIARVRVYDMLGLFCLPVFHPQKQAITASAYVLPQLPEVLPRIQASSQQALSSEVYSPYKPGNDPSYLFGVREYREGDSMRHVHWKLSTRLNKLMVKEFGLPLQAGVHFVVRLYQKGAIDQADRLVTAVLALSQALLEQEIPHRISWIDSTNSIQTSVLYNQEDLAQAANGLLQMGCLPQGDAALPSLHANEHVLYMADFSPQTRQALLGDIQALLAQPFSVQVSAVLAGQEGAEANGLQTLGCPVYWLDEEMQTEQLEAIAL